MEINLFVYLYVHYKKINKHLKLCITRIIYFAKFVSRTFHFWGHLTIHYAGEICMCPFFPLFGHMARKRQKFCLRSTFFRQQVHTKVRSRFEHQVWHSYQNATLTTDQNKIEVTSIQKLAELKKIRKVSQVRTIKKSSKKVPPKKAKRTSPANSH